jgi:hypothetical protein
MLAYLIGTSILNIFLGYALAVYLMRESMAAAHSLAPKESFGSPLPPLGESREAPTHAGGPPTPAPTTEFSGREGSSSAGSTSSDPTAIDAANFGAEQLDQQLLAGIADFRNQLAKLRAQADPDEQPRRRPTPRPAAK